jgi:hypothetical protein
MLSAIPVLFLLVGVVVGAVRYLIYS